MKITSLRNQIFETTKILQKSGEEIDGRLVLENQLEIMRSLFKIEEDLARVKKSYHHPDCGPA